MAFEATQLRRGLQWSGQIVGQDFEVSSGPGIPPQTVGDVAHYLPLEPQANTQQSLYATVASGPGSTHSSSLGRGFDPCPPHAPLHSLW